MRDILGHKSRDIGEIIDILAARHNYTCPTLPHYRYDRVKSACYKLRKLRLVRESGRTQESVNLVTTDLFKEWQAAVAAGETRLGAVKWAKARAALAQEAP